MDDFCQRVVRVARLWGGCVLTLTVPDLVKFMADAPYYVTNTLHMFDEIGAAGRSGFLM
jgi:hypothetical protein